MTLSLNIVWLYPCAQKHVQLPGRFVQLKTPSPLHPYFSGSVHSSISGRINHSGKLVVTVVILKFTTTEKEQNMKPVQFSTGFIIWIFFISATYSMMFYMHLKQFYIKLIGASVREKVCLWGIATNKGADLPAHQRSLISTFVKYCY